MLLRHEQMGYGDGNEKRVGMDRDRQDEVTHSIYMALYRFTGWFDRMVVAMRFIKIFPDRFFIINWQMNVLFRGDGVTRPQSGGDGRLNRLMMIGNREFIMSLSGRQSSPLTMSIVSLAQGREVLTRLGYRRHHHSFLSLTARKL